MTSYHPHTIARRAQTARVVLLGAFGVLFVAFFRTQILAQSELEMRSEDNRLRIVRVPAPRGRILDRHGRALAENVPGYSIAVLPGPADSIRATLHSIAGFIGLDTARIEGLIERHRRAQHLPLTVISDASFAMVSSLVERRASIANLLIQTEPKRSYPLAEAAAHVLGFVGEVSEAELGLEAFAGLPLGTVVGKDGLERVYEDTLRGRDGQRFVEVDARGRLVRDADPSRTLPPIPGADITTTIDLDLQQFIYDTYREMYPRFRRGAVVAMDPRTGEILASVSSPSFDPNAFVSGVEPGQWRAWREDPDRPFMDRTIEARYPPASPFKLAVAASALKRGLVTMNTHMPEPCRGGFQYGDRYFRCWKEGGHGDLTLSEAIAQSCDVYFYQLGLRIGLTDLLADGGAMGFLDRSGVDLPNEVRPQFPTGRDYFDRLYGPRGWTTGVTLNLAIGQGENAQTLMNVVRLFAALASDGTLTAPYVVRRQDDGESPRLGLSKRQLKSLRASLVAVLEGGTARRSLTSEIQIAGKTGTAQNSQGEDHGWFIGFAPANKPEIVVGAIVEFIEHGSSVAPLAVRTIARHLLGVEGERRIRSELYFQAGGTPAPSRRGIP